MPSLESYLGQYTITGPLPNSVLPPGMEVGGTLTIAPVEGQPHLANLLWGEAFQLALPWIPGDGGILFGEPAILKDGREDRHFKEAGASLLVLTNLKVLAGALQEEDGAEPATFAAEATPSTYSQSS